MSQRKPFFSQYRPLFQVFYVYWRIYGGAEALYKSPYFHISVAVAAISAPLWWGSQDWAGLTLDCIPNILGFSIGAFAVILLFGQNSLDMLKNKDEGNSRYLGVMSFFVHFIVIQSLALIVAIIGKSWGNIIIGFVGTTLFVYAIALAVAGAMRLFRLARIYNQIEPNDQKPRPEKFTVQEV